MGKAKLNNRAKRKANQSFPEIYVTPEFIAKHGSQLVPAVKGGIVGGKALYTTYRKQSPIEGIKSLADHEKAAGAWLHQLYYDAGFEALRASDPSKEFVDGQGSTDISERKMDAQNAYNKAIVILLPRQMAVISYIVLQERTLSQFERDYKTDIRVVSERLKTALEVLSLHFGFSSIVRNNRSGGV